jgi:large subunit ribosomal protein L10
MPNLVNRLVAEEYERTFGEAGGMVIVSMAGLTVKELEALRASLAERGAKLLLVRNKLARRALAGRGLEMGEEVFRGNVAVAFGTGEAAVLAAKVLTAPEIRKAGKLSLRAGVLEGSVLGASDAAALAEIPDRQTLRAQLLGVLHGPMRALAVSIQALPAGLARLLQARADQLTVPEPPEPPEPPDPPEPAVPAGEPSSPGAEAPLA